MILLKRLKGHRKPFPPHKPDLGLLPQVPLVWPLTSATAQAPLVAPFSRHRATPAAPHTSTTQGRGHPSVTFVVLMDLQKKTVGRVVAVLGQPGSPSCKLRVKCDDQLVLVCPPNEYPMPAWTSQVAWGREVEFIPTSVARAEGLDYIGRLEALVNPEPFKPVWEQEGHKDRLAAIQANRTAADKPAGKEGSTVVSEKVLYDRLRHLFHKEGQKLRKHRDDGTYYAETSGKNRYLKRYGMQLCDLITEYGVLQPGESLESDNQAL